MTPENQLVFELFLTFCPLVFSEASFRLQENQGLKNDLLYIVNANISSII